MCAPIVIQPGRTVRERRYVQQQLYTVRQSCQREEVCAPTAMQSEAEPSVRGGVRTDSYAQSGRAVRERRRAYRQLCTVRQSCQREVCALTVIHSEAELSETGGVRTELYSQAELSERGGVCTDSYAQ